MAAATTNDILWRIDRKLGNIQQLLKQMTELMESEYVNASQDYSPEYEKDSRLKFFSS